MLHLKTVAVKLLYDLQGKAAKIMVWDDIKTMTPLFATTSVEGTVDPAPTLKPTAPTSQPETTPTAEPTATPTVALHRSVCNIL